MSQLPLAYLIDEHLILNNIIDLTALTLFDENWTETHIDFTIFCRAAL